MGRGHFSRLILQAEFGHGVLLVGVSVWCGMNGRLLALQKKLVDGLTRH